MQVRKEVADAETVIARIKGKPTADELIEIQEDRDEEPEKEPEEHMWIHTHDDGGSFVYTPMMTGIWPHENTLTRFTDRKVRR